MFDYIVKFKKIDITILLRGFSIFSIVSGHFGFVGMVGGAFYLIFLSGYNFVKFTLPKTINSQNNNSFCVTLFTKNYFNFLIKLLIPVLLYTIVVYTLLGRPYFAGLFLVSNFYGPDYGQGLSFWFLEVLVQIYLLFYLLALSNKYYNWLGKNPFVSFLIAFIFWFLASLLCRYFWDTTAWLDRFPHLMIYIFLLGALIASINTFKEKMIASLCVASVCFEFYFYGFSGRSLFLIIGSLLTIWVSVLSVPIFLHKFIYTIAMSSLFIYLSHFQARSLLMKMPVEWPPLLTVSFALLFGVVMAKSWKNRKFIYGYLLPLKGK